MTNLKILNPKLIVFLVLSVALLLAIAAIASPKDPVCWCCYKTGTGALAVSHVVQTTPIDCKKKHGQCYASQADAQLACSGRKACWCCYPDNTIDQKRVVYMPSAQCAAKHGTCYATQAAANAVCHY